MPILFIALYVFQSFYVSHSCSIIFIHTFGVCVQCVLHSPDN